MTAPATGSAVPSRRGVVRRTRLATATLLMLLGTLALEGGGLRRDNAYNDAVENRLWDTAARHDSAYGRLAKAVALHRDGDVNAAVAAYGELSERDGALPWRTARYNLATLYLEQAQTLAADNSMRVPLIELAKQLFRDLLRVDAGDWDARYNLSRALEALPDVEVTEDDEDENPERAPRAPLANPAYERLP